jgi:hypothetical protein
MSSENMTTIDRIYGAFETRDFSLSSVFYLLRFTSHNVRRFHGEVSFTVLRKQSCSSER